MLTYTIRFNPGAYYTAPAQSSDGIQYHSIISDSTRQPVAFVFDENMAKTICLSLDLISAMVHGDRSKTRELTKLIEVLSRGGMQ